MTTPNSPETETKVPKVEVDFDPNSFSRFTEKFAQIQRQFQGWYEALPTLAKVAVAIALVFIALSLLGKVLNLIASLISVTIMAVVLYGLYRIFLRPKSSQNDS